MEMTCDIFGQEENISNVSQALHNSASTGPMTAVADVKYLTSMSSEPQLLL